MPRPARRVLGVGLALTAAAVCAVAQYGSPDPPPAAVAVRVRVPAEANANTKLTYRLSAENVSRAAAHHVLLKAVVPAGAKLVSTSPNADGEGANLLWKFGTLEPGQRREVTLVIEPTTADDLDVCARVQFEHGQCVRTRVNRPGLNVRRTGPTTAVLYDPVTFKLEVTNTGRATVKNVVLEESLPKGLDFSTSKPSTKGDNPLVWELGDVAPGQVKRVEYDAFVKESGSLAVRTLLRGDGVEQKKAFNLEVGQAALDVTLSGPAAQTVGRPARYVITVVNRGSAPLTGVKLTDELPADIVFVGASGGRLDRDVVRWDVGTVPPGTRRAYSVDVRSQKAGKFKNVITATADRGLIEQGKATTLFTEGRVAVVVDGGAEVVAGQETTAVVRVVNVGDAREERLDLVVTLPEGLELIEARGPGKPEKKDKSRVIFGPIEGLEPGGEVTATLRVLARAVGEYKVQAAAGAAKDEDVVVVRAK